MRLVVAFTLGFLLMMLVLIDGEIITQAWQ
jgi:hypothetical protein